MAPAHRERVLAWLDPSVSGTAITATAESSSSLSRMITGLQHKVASRGDGAAGACG